MPEDARGPRAVPLPPDTERDTRLLFAFRPAALPWLLGALLWGTAAFVLPLPAAAKVPLGLLLPGGALAALAADAPERFARLRRYWTDSPDRYLGRPTPGNIRARYSNGMLGVALDVLPPPWAGRDGDGLEAERAAWVRVARRLKSTRALAAVTVEMVADEPPRPGWDVPADLPLPPGYARFASLRRAHFEALVREGRARRPRALLRLAVRERGAGDGPELRLDRLANGVAAELAAVGVLAVPVDLDALASMAGAPSMLAETAARHEAGERPRVAPSPTLSPPTAIPRLRSPSPTPRPRPLLSPRRPAPLRCSASRCLRSGPRPCRPCSAAPSQRQRRPFRPHRRAID